MPDCLQAFSQSFVFTWKYKFLEQAEEEHWKEFIFGINQWVWLYVLHVNPNRCHFLYERSLSSNKTSDRMRILNKFEISGPLNTNLLPSLGLCVKRLTTFDEFWVCYRWKIFKTKKKQFKFRFLLSLTMFSIRRKKSDGAKLYF